MACANVIVACQYIDHGIIAHHCLTPFPTVGSMVTTDMVLKAFKGAWSVFTFLFYFIFYFFTFFLRIWEIWVLKAYTFLISHGRFS